MQRPTDIFVGGAGDRLFKCAKRYADRFAQDHGDRTVIYLPQGHRRKLRQIIANHPVPGALNLIGHSWGAADVAWAVERAHSTQTFDTVIGIDPVGKYDWRKRAWDHCVQRIVTVHATGSEGRVSDGNITARIGRIIGQSCPAVFNHPRALCLDTPFAHYDMTRMMTHPGDDGFSAQDWLLGRSVDGYWVP